MKCIEWVKNALKWLTFKMTMCCCLSGANAKHKELDGKEFNDEISEEELNRLRPS